MNSSWLPITLSYITNITTLVATATDGQPWWVSLIVSLVSPILYFLIKFLFDKMITKAHNNKEITDKQRKDLQDVADKITDNGGKNNGKNNN